MKCGLGKKVPRRELCGCNNFPVRRLGARTNAERQPNRGAILGSMEADGNEDNPADQFKDTALIIPAQANRKASVHAYIPKPAIHMQGVEAVLHRKKKPFHKTSPKT